MSNELTDYIENLKNAFKESLTKGADAAVNSVITQESSRQTGKQAANQIGSLVGNAAGKAAQQSVEEVKQKQAKQRPFQMAGTEPTIMKPIRPKSLLEDKLSEDNNNNQDDQDSQDSQSKPEETTNAFDTLEDLAHKPLENIGENTPIIKRTGTLQERRNIPSLNNSTTKDALDNTLGGLIDPNKKHPVAAVGDFLSGLTKVPEDKKTPNVTPNSPELTDIYKSIYNQPMTQEEKDRRSFDTYNGANITPGGGARGDTPDTVMDRRSTFSYKPNYNYATPISDTMRNLTDVLTGTPQTVSNATTPDEEWRRRLVDYGYDPNDPNAPKLEDAASYPELNPANIEKRIDDGNMRATNQLSRYITGAQLKKQLEAGVPGPDPSTIRDDRVYDKSWLASEEGYKPQVNSPVEFGLNMLRDAALAPSDFFNNLRRARENHSTYEGNIDGIKYDGRDFKSKSQDYLIAMNRAINNGIYNEGLVTEDPNIDHTGMTPLTNGNLTFTDEDGNKTEFGDGIGVSQVLSGNPDKEPDKPFTLMMDDGQMLAFNDVNDYNSSMSYNLRDANDGETPVAWRYSNVPNLVLNDGTELTVDQVRRADNGEGDNNYGFLNWGKPSDLLHSTDPQDIVPGATDLLASSAPYFITPISMWKALGDSYKASQGVDPYSFDSENGEGKELNENITPERYNSAVTANAIMPFTELLWGNIGHKGAGIAGKAIDKALPASPVNPILHWAKGPVGEAMEEIPGNIVEELTNQSPSTWYANPVTDENGNELYDTTQHPLKDPNTSVTDRISNFMGNKTDDGKGNDFSEVLSAMQGGGAMGLMMGIPELFGSIGKAKNMHSNNKTAKVAGETARRIPSAEKVYKPATWEDQKQNMEGK